MGCERTWAGQRRSTYRNESGLGSIVRRVLVKGAVALLLLAVATRTADALRVGGSRLRCGCTESCWCKRPGLTIFRWVTPGRWHELALTPEEKRSRSTDGE